MPRGRKRTAGDLPADNGTVDATQKLKERRTCPSTKPTYQYKVNVMTDWLRTHHRETLNDDLQAIRIPINKDAVLAFFGHICAPAWQCGGDSTVGSDKLPMSASCVFGYRSALVDLYRQNQLELDPILNTELKSTLDGYQKLLNDLKKRGLMKVNEGKRHLKPCGYSLLAIKLMQQTPDSCSQTWPSTVFSWCYFVVMWNLMSRSDSVDAIMLQHVEWSEDCLVIEEQGHKGDQTGADKYGKHVYANPYEPSKCPILAIAILLSCCPYRLANGQQQLFSGTDKSRFGKMLQRLLDTLSEDELSQLGCSTEDVGVHSLRKGSWTHSLGQINGPNPVCHVCLTSHARHARRIGMCLTAHVPCVRSVKACVTCA